MGDCEWDCCENFQTAICLHCMRRLCIYHIQDHQEILLNEIDEIKNDINEINIVLTNASNAIVEECKAKENKCINWRQQKMDEIERDYNGRMQVIINRQKQLQQLELELNHRLKVEVQQPLEDMSLEKSINPQLLDTIQLAIETVRRDSELLTWNPPKSNNDQQKSNSSKTRKAKKIKKWKPSDCPYTLFRDVGPGSVDKINEYVQTMKGENAMDKYGLIKLIFSYVRAWYQTKADRAKYKQLILTKHILTIKQYIIEKDSQRKVLIALQFFFNSLKQPEIETMTMLLQFFFAHQCISMPEIIDWYLNDNFVDESLAKKVEKNWAEPFLHLNGYSIELKDDMPSTILNSSETLSKSSSEYREHVRIRKPFKNLVKLFKDQSNKNDVAIHEYIEMQYKTNVNQRVIMIIRCYLEAWNECLSNMKNEYLLTKISILEYYKSDRTFEMQVLFAIEIFLSQNKNIQNSLIEEIFQFFYHQHLIKKETFLKWNSDGHLYYKKTKHLAQTFIQQLMTEN